MLHSSSIPPEDPELPLTIFALKERIHNDCFSCNNQPCYPTCRWGDAHQRTHQMLPSFIRSCRELHDSYTSTHR